MKVTILISIIILTSCMQRPNLKNGDIIFHTSMSSQSIAIQKATKSTYSHMGIIYILNGRPFVYEAIQPVKLTPLDAWIKRGSKKHFVVKRLKETSRLTPDVLKEMKTYGETFLGHDYDLTFEWSDDRMYCSELVWKIYKNVLDIEIGKRQKLKDFDLSDQRVKAIMEKRYGSEIPYEEWVISPAAMFESELLETVYQN